MCTMYCVDCWNIIVVLCKTLSFASFLIVSFLIVSFLTSFHLIDMHRVVLSWLLEYDYGSTLGSKCSHFTGFGLTCTMWYCVDCWNIWFCSELQASPLSSRHKLWSAVVLHWLPECMMIWVLFSNQIDVIFLIWLQLMYTKDSPEVLQVVISLCGRTYQTETAIGETCFYSATITPVPPATFVLHGLLPLHLLHSIICMCCFKNIWHPLSFEQIPLIQIYQINHIFIKTINFQLFLLPQKH